MWLAMWLVLTGTAQAVSWQSVVDEAEQAWTSGGGASSAAASGLPEAASAPLRPEQGERVIRDV